MKFDEYEKCGVTTMPGGQLVRQAVDRDLELEHARMRRVGCLPEERECAVRRPDRQRRVTLQQRAERRSEHVVRRLADEVEHRRPGLYELLDRVGVLRHAVLDDRGHRRWRAAQEARIPVRGRGSHHVELADVLAHLQLGVRVSAGADRLLERLQDRDELLVVTDLLAVDLRRSARPGRPACRRSCRRRRTARSGRGCRTTRPSAGCPARAGACRRCRRRHRRSGYGGRSSVNRSDAAPTPLSPAFAATTRGSGSRNCSTQLRSNRSWKTER